MSLLWKKCSKDFVQFKKNFIKKSLLLAIGRPIVLDKIKHGLNFLVFNFHRCSLKSHLSFVNEYPYFEDFAVEILAYIKACP